jgi:HSP20 family protein
MKGEGINMHIMRWDPFRDITTLHSRMNDLFGDSLARAEGNFGNWLPPVEILEKDENLVMRAEIPGMSEKDIDLTVENGVMTLRGEKKREKELENDNVHRAERYYGSFVRTFALPTTVDTDKIRAAYKDGVLEVLLPKAETAKAKRIAITA